ncbi:MAG: pyridoxamine 5'-phosphate oxidase [Sphingobacteriales bacterium]|nr:MAG: pyridoxamine 5'-phosphate oxidase [Sphingobacteriales bacterium]
MDNTLAGLREDYKRATLDRADTGSDPLLFFRNWLDEALAAQVPEPNAMTLATVDVSGQPHARIVLLKGLEDGQFVFYTNYESHKAAEISENGRVALVFFWPELERQVRIEGLIAKVSAEMSEAYFAVRPRRSQLGAWASPQSREVTGREVLEERFQEAESRFEGVASVPRPTHWGGYGVTAHLMEFWQGRRSRMHDRIVFRKTDGGWEPVRLAP